MMRRYTQYIEADGACRNNGRPNAIAAIGVYFHDATEYNVSKVLQVTRATNQVAELSAGIRALEQALVYMTYEQGSYDEVVVVSDSSYFVKGCNEWIPTWRNNGYLNYKGEPVINRELFRRLEELVDTVNVLGYFHIKHIPRECSGMADSLANNALDAYKPTIKPNPNAWILSSVGQHHICRSRHLFTSYHAIFPLKVKWHSGPTRMYAMGIGTIELDVLLPHGSKCKATLENALHVPEMPWSLFARTGVCNVKPAFGHQNGSVPVLQLVDGPRALYPDVIPTSKVSTMTASAWIDGEPALISDLGK